MRKNIRFITDIKQRTYSKFIHIEHERQEVKLHKLCIARPRVHNEFAISRPATIPGNKKQ